MTGIPVMRAVIYARFSSDLQDARSLADQIALAKNYASARQLPVLSIYEDAAISGATIINRPGIQQLLEDAAAGRFDLIITESIDRLSRGQADIAWLYERLTFFGVRIETLADGQVSEIHIGLKGTMAALFLKDLAQKTRRGQIGRVKAGRIPGGKSYGYDVVRSGGERGERSINQEEAIVVRRIYDDYAAGKSPLAIVRELNQEGIPGPSGGRWNASALLGSRKRRNGILNNELYRGVIVYNRQRFVKDPATGKRLARENPESEWHRQDVPELRIIDDTLWDKVQAIRSAGRATSLSAPAAKAPAFGVAPMRRVWGQLQRGQRRADALLDSGQFKGLLKHSHDQSQRGRGEGACRAAKLPLGARNGGSGGRSLSRGTAADFRRPA